MNVSKFLIERLENAGVKHIFNIPGDYVLDFCKELWDSKNIDVINNTDENHSGFAADAYARVNGIGCVVTTYSVGASKVINAVQCAFAERSPLIVISGAPGLAERNEGFLLHHMVRSFNSQKKMFDEITCASIVLDNPATAGYEIDRAFEALQHYKRPIYIELPRDVAKQTISYDVYKLGTPKTALTDQENLAEALIETSNWIQSSEKPVILAGVELARYKLAEPMMRFAEKHDIPVATTLLSKSVINERHPLFAGIYAGNASQDMTRQIVEKSDCLLMFGVMLTDMCLCFRPAQFKKRQVVSASVESLKIRNHTFTDIRFQDFCKDLFKLDLGRKLVQELPPQKTNAVFESRGDVKITTERVFEKINSILDHNMAIVADIGDSLFGAADLTVHNSHHFLSPAFYTSMGYAIPGVLGVSVACPGVRTIGIVGDGAFQMSCTELSTIAARGYNPIIFLLNNDGYTTERFLLDGKFNDLRRWHYHKITEVIGAGKGYLVQTESELESAVKEAIDSTELSVINIILDRKDVSRGLKRMTEALTRKI